MELDQSEIEKIKFERKQEKEAYRKLKIKKRRNIILNTVSIVLVLIGLSWAASVFIRYIRYEITNDATVEQYITAIHARVTGYVKEIRFTDHQWVNAGDTLLVIDDSEYRIDLMEAQAALLDAKNSMPVLVSNIATSNKNVDVSDANIQAAKAQLWKKEQDLKRYSNLLATGSVSEQQYDYVKSDYDSQKAKFDALMREKESLKYVSKGAEAKIGNIKANILRQEAKLNMAKLNLSYTIITAPFSGYVGRRSLEVGELVSIGQTITNLVRNDDKWVVANYREMQIKNIYIGQKVRVKVDAFPGKVFYGKVTTISEATGQEYSLLPTDNSAGNFVKIQQRIPVRIDFIDISTDDMKKLRAGMMLTSEALKK